MEIRKYVNIDKSEIVKKEKRSQAIDDLIREVKEGTIHLIVEEGNLVQINCTQNIRY